jgi:hypothetical protein
MESVRVPFYSATTRASQLAVLCDDPSGGGTKKEDEQNLTTQTKRVRRPIEFVNPVTSFSF